MDKRFDFKKVEDKLYKAWEKGGFFDPDQAGRVKPANKRTKKEAGADYFSMVMPPPNVTGTLHAGHGTFLAIQDLMTRWARMKGLDTLYLPGTDHAAIATQNKVEKELLKNQDKSRHDLGREEFLKEIEKFVEQSKNIIHSQIRKMGTSCDWGREAYTMDQTRNRVVKTVFKRMYEDGLIYRGERIVNWCPRCESTLADDEVEYRQEQAKLYYLAYPFTDGSGQITIATTRPETMLADTAVAVNPKDRRYQSLVGKIVKLPLVGREIPVIADDYVDSAFGTGALKITPAHDPNDWRIGQRHQLETINIFNEDGSFNQQAGTYQGLKGEERREKVVADLEAGGFLKKIEDCEHNISTCYRCDTALEPITSRQWFVDVNKKALKQADGSKVSLKEKALQVVADGEIQIIPKRFNKIYNNWIENLYDWCISRQLWFGHRIPVWYCACGEVIVAIDEPKKCPKCGGQELSQDEDTLDTWFSSGTWTFSTFYQDPAEVRLDENGFLKKNALLKKYHPTMMLETGYDILFFWVARMILITTYSMGEIPFRQVYLHGLVRDKQGRKMSKSLGNGIDPVDMVEKYGADATRLALLIGGTPGNDLRIYEEKISGFAKFITKLWNIARFIKAKNEAAGAQAKELTAIDHYIFWRWEELLREVSADLDHYRFSAAGEKLKDFTWNELADWYLEIAKIEPGKEKLLLALLKGLLKLWHPFIPFVTEEIWSEIKDQDDPRLIVAARPQANELIGKDWIDQALAKRYLNVIDVIEKIRKAVNLYQVPVGAPITVAVNTTDEAIAQLIETQAKIIEKLAQGAEIGQVPQSESIKIPFRKGVLEIGFGQDFDLGAARSKLNAEIKAIERYVNSIEKKLENKAFVDKAPAEIVAKEKDKLALQKSKLKDLRLEKNK